MSDLISRQAAIDALDKRFDKIPMEQTTEILKLRKDLRELPSAQPEQRWIPVTERLPEESKRYLISVLDGVSRRTTVAQYQSRNKAWTLTGRMAYWKVVAWMPLPEPYDGGEQDE